MTSFTRGAGFAPSWWPSVRGGSETFSFTQAADRSSRDSSPTAHTTLHTAEFKVATQRSHERGREFWFDTTVCPELTAGPCQYPSLPVTFFISGVDSAEEEPRKNSFKSQQSLKRQKREHSARQNTHCSTHIHTRAKREREVNTDTHIWFRFGERGTERAPSSREKFAWFSTRAHTHTATQRYTHTYIHLKQVASRRREHRNNRKNDTTPARSAFLDILASGFRFFRFSENVTFVA